MVQRGMSMCLCISVWSGLDGYGTWHVNVAWGVLKIYTVSSYTIVHYYTCLNIYDQSFWKWLNKWWINELNGSNTHALCYETISLVKFKIELFHWSNLKWTYLIELLNENLMHQFEVKKCTLWNKKTCS